MSFFTPHKRHPRKFNYIPRYFDPVKDARDERRKELHGTSEATDDMPYTPGRYVRTQREAREATRGERNAFAGLSRFFFLAVAMVFVVLLFYPRFMKFVERANEEKMLQSMPAQPTGGDAEEVERGITIYEKHEDIDFNEFESLTPETLREMEEWQSSIGEITIYDDDVEIVDGKKVEK